MSALICLRTLRPHRLLSQSGIRISLHGRPYSSEEAQSSPNSAGSPRVVKLYSSAFVLRRITASDEGPIGPDSSPSASSDSRLSEMKPINETRKVYETRRSLVLDKGEQTRIRRDYKEQKSLSRRKAIMTPPSEETKELMSLMRQVIEDRRAQLSKFKKEHGQSKIGEVKVENVIGGMRGLKSLLWEGSSLDAEQGIRFRGRTISECNDLLPKTSGTTQMLPEAMFWLLLTGQIPSGPQTRGLSRDLARRSSNIPGYALDMITRAPRTTHPMVLLSSIVALLSHQSKFSAAYAEGSLPKPDYWEHTLDDALNLIAWLPLLAARIYHWRLNKPAPLSPEDAEKLSPREAENAHHPNFYKQPPIDPERDWAHNFSTLLGMGGDIPHEKDFQDLMRLYLALHGDHEGGNVSAHATHLVGSALSDVYLSYSAGLAGLAGPLHGLAAQEVVRFVEKMADELGSSAKWDNDDVIRAYLEAHLAKGQVIPGYGHAVLRRPDPRFEALVAFAEARPEIAEGETSLFRLVRKLAQIAPEVLTKHGKTKNPFPNVDAASGVLFHHYGFRDTLFYTVLFGVSRGLGPLAQLVWDRALGLPIERPKSVTLEGLMAAVEEAKGEEPIKAKL